MYLEQVYKSYTEGSPLQVHEQRVQLSEENLSN